MRLLRIILVVMFGLCLTMKVQGAEAHSFMAPSHTDTYKASSSANAGAMLVAVAFGQDDDCCDDGCCGPPSTGCGCCAAVLPTTMEMQYHESSSGVVVSFHAILPQGFLFTLLRPPRTAA